MPRGGDQQKLEPYISVAVKANKIFGMRASNAGVDVWNAGNASLEATLDPVSCYRDKNHHFRSTPVADPTESGLRETWPSQWTHISVSPNLQWVTVADQRGCACLLADYGQCAVAEPDPPTAVDLVTYGTVAANEDASPWQRTTAPYQRQRVPREAGPWLRAAGNNIPTSTSIAPPSSSLSGFAAETASAESASGSIYGHGSWNNSAPSSLQPASSSTDNTDEGSPGSDQQNPEMAEVFVAGQGSTPGPFRPPVRLLETGGGSGTRLLSLRVEASVLVQLQDAPDGDIRPVGITAPTAIRTIAYNPSSGAKCLLQRTQTIQDKQHPGEPLILMVPGGRGLGGWYWLHSQRLWGLVWDQTQEQILHNLIMVEGTQVADRLCVLNSWDTKTLHIHALVLGLRYRQPDVVESALQSLVSSQRAEGCRLLLSHIQQHGDYHTDHQLLLRLCAIGVCVCVVLCCVV